MQQLLLWKYHFQTALEERLRLLALSWKWRALLQFVLIALLEDQNLNSLGQFVYLLR